MDKLLSRQWKLVTEMEHEFVERTRDEAEWKRSYDSFLGVMDDRRLSKQHMSYTVQLCIFNPKESYMTVHISGDVPRVYSLGSTEQVESAMNFICVVRLGNYFAGYGTFNGIGAFSVPPEKIAERIYGSRVSADRTEFDVVSALQVLGHPDGIVPSVSTVVDIFDPDFKQTLSATLDRVL